MMTTVLVPASDATRRTVSSSPRTAPVDERCTEKVLVRTNDPRTASHLLHLSLAIGG